MIQKFMRMSEEENEVLDSVTFEEFMKPDCADPVADHIANQAV